MMKVQRKKKQKGASRSVAKSWFSISINPRWTLFTLLVSVLAVSSYQAFAWLKSALDMPIESVAIAGEFQYVKKIHLEKLIEPYAGKNYFTVDLEAIKETLETEAWIDIVSVRRRWPDQLAIVVKEQLAIAQWQEGSFLNASGQVFSPKSIKSIENLPRLKGSDGAHREVLSDYYHFNSLLSPMDLFVVEFTVDRKGAKTLLLNNGIFLVMGAKDGDERIARFKNIYTSQLVARVSEIHRIDMRYTHGLAVKWKPNLTALAKQ